MNPVPQQAPSPLGMTMRMPGQPQPMAVRTYVSSGAPQKRLGIIPMAPDSAHMMRIGNVRAQVTCRDRRGFPQARGMHFCMHPGCAGKWWATETELKNAHRPHEQLVADGEVHLIGFWSDDDCNPPVNGCKQCDKATEAASKKAGDVVIRACDEHSGGAIGLLTNADPNA